ncbi:hypothetical protein BpHYR1_048266 [Brachionus plicatilis]|uniref:Uncharacterized protein n=1 Tax=Brachionus plicatilis TaxID=10195 RepID=A0A3M7RSR0_BRAPC|nr:hypothetical protein BpHYR1_048266 [Brachionus plicatilis]
MHNAECTPSKKCYFNKFILNFFFLFQKLFLISNDKLFELMINSKIPLIAQLILRQSPMGTDFRQFILNFFPNFHSDK